MCYYDLAISSSRLSNLSCKFVNLSSQCMVDDLFDNKPMCLSSGLPGHFSVLVVIFAVNLI